MRSPRPEPRLRGLSPTVATLGDLVAPAPKVAAPIYRSPEWRALLAAVKRQRGARCERCGSRHRLIGDHVVELSDGGAPYDPSNIDLLCQACHNTKTAQARAARARGRVHGVAGMGSPG